MRTVAALLTLSLTLHGALARGQRDAGAGDADVTDVPVSQGDASVRGDASAVDDDAPDPLDEPPTADEQNAAERAAPDPEDPADAGVATGTREGEAIPDVPRVAVEIAALSDRACLRALSRTAVPFIRVRQRVPGVVLPVMVRGPVRGVTIRGRGTPVEQELMDCRLALALARYAPTLRAMGVRELRHISLHRPAAAATIARHPVQTRHPAGLAIDVAAVVFDDGRVLDVLRDFHGRRGAPLCGPTARVPADPGARRLRAVACEAARRGYFNVVLTPNFNLAHRNHFHLEVARDVSWVYVH